MYTGLLGSKMEVTLCLVQGQGNYAILLQR
jgi:hypothetical protein